jgi:hypothetical protein
VGVQLPSTAISTGVEVVVLPWSSVAMATSDCGPAGGLVQTKRNGGAETSPILRGPAWKATERIDPSGSGSEAAASRVTGRPRPKAEPEVGLTRRTRGGALTSRTTRSKALVTVKGGSPLSVMATTTWLVAGPSSSRGFQTANPEALTVRPGGPARRRKRWELAGTSGSATRSWARNGASSSITVGEGTARVGGAIDFADADEEAGAGALGRGAVVRDLGGDGVGVVGALAFVGGSR